MDNLLLALIYVNGRRPIRLPFKGFGNVIDSQFDIVPKAHHQTILLQSRLLGRFEYIKSRLEYYEKELNLAYDHNLISAGFYKSKTDYQQDTKCEQEMIHMIEHVMT